MADFLATLCHTDVDNPFPVLINGGLSHCFNLLVLSVLPHSFLACISACYLGTARSRWRGSVWCGWRCRITASFLLALLFLMDVLVVVAWTPDLATLWLEVLAGLVSALAWLVHGMAAVTLSRLPLGSQWGPVPLGCLPLLPIPTLIITLVSDCRLGYLSWDWDSPPPAILRSALVCIELSLLFIYLLAFIISCLRAGELVEGVSEREPLLPRAGYPEGRPVEEDGAGCLSRLFYLWLNPMMERGRSGELSRPCDVCLLPPALEIRQVEERMAECWQRCRGASWVSAGQGDPSKSWRGLEQPEVAPSLVEQEELCLLSVFHRAFGRRYYMLGLLKLMASMLGFVGPLLLSCLVTYMESDSQPVSLGFAYALGLCLSTLTAAFLSNQFSYQVLKVSLEARAAMVCAVYRKALRVNATTLSSFTTGEIVNFMSTDTERLMNFFPSFHELWSLPLTFAVTLYLLHLQVGVAFLGGLGVAILLVPLNKVIASKIIQSTSDMLQHKDARVKLMTEILFGIRVLKFYTWEKHFISMVQSCRKKELSCIKVINYLDAVCVYTWAALPVVISILTFMTYVLLGHKLTAPKVFTTLALVEMLIMPLNNFPWILNGILEAKVSLERIQRFLKLSDQDLSSYYTTSTDGCWAVKLHDATFSWVHQRASASDLSQPDSSSSQEGSLELCNLNLRVKQGALVGVLGKVGCGKSSLLAAITGEINRKDGTVSVSVLERGFGLTTQEAWIQHMTIQDNILFGKEFDAKRYHDVIEACALSEDLNMLPAGDQTEVGENGITLSGGQKARIALARAVYMDQDLYLLDDPLAAVDSDVAGHLMEQCIMGILKDKTRILCTHRAEFLNKADVLVLMDNGRIIRADTPAEILPLVQATSSIHSKEAYDIVCTDSVQVSEEDKKVGAVTLRVYSAYWHAVGCCLAFSILVSLLLMQASRNVSDWWLSNWISNLQHQSNMSGNGSSTSSSTFPHLLLFYSNLFISPVTVGGNLSSQVKFYLTVYGCIAASNTVFTALRAFLFAYSAIRAATTIHNKLLKQVLKATVTFFDMTPVGRIVNRFSSDLYCMDDTLPFILNIFLANLFGLLGTVIVIIYGLPWIVLMLLPLAALYFHIQRYYRCTSRELKRLSSLSLSSIYTQFSETLTGLSTIRASRAMDRFEWENASRLETNQRCLFASGTAIQWLDIRLQMVGVAVVTAIAAIAVIEHQMKVGDPGLVGLALSYALSITNVLSGLVSNFTQTEMQMVSVERIEEYSTEIPTEPQHSTLQVPDTWPAQGLVEFRDVVLRYRPGLPRALNRVNFQIRVGERVGIVGRTGSGKSSMFLALFRMVELSEGQILIDGIDTKAVSLEELRSRLAIIPQDAFLFSGSVRENLDPLGRHTEQQLLRVLKQCHLLQLVNRMGGLGAELGEKGRNLSAGQKQLVCLARALLTQAKVLCIDEATASVDQRTDQLLQQTIREEFADKTVLTIAHRLNTVMDSDRVLVMQAGRVKEFDSPLVLSQKQNSHFYQLLHCSQD
uniref:ATP-binding cassette, sub-family C (CFTR/MRP), member 10 n=1 Tax=Callorhinchus milii TaxID=7868 RepID=A0A4W3JI11_CALMI